MTSAATNTAVVLPRRLPRGIVAPFLVIPFGLWILVGYVLDNEQAAVAAGIAGSVILGAGIMVEAMELARRRAHIYRDLGIQIPAEMARSMGGSAPVRTPALVVILFMSAMFAGTAINHEWPLWAPIFLTWLLLGLVAIFVGGPLWLRHRAKLRDVTMQRVASQAGLNIDVQRKFGDQSQYALWGERDGRQVQIHTNGSLRVAVLVKEFDGEFIRFVTSTFSDRRRMRRAGPILSTGDSAFDRRFLTQSVPPERGIPFFDDTDLRQELLLRQQLGRFYLVVGGNGLLMTQDYPRADAEYLEASISLAVQLAKRWDGQEKLDFPASA